MSSPTRSDVHVNRPLTNILTAYVQSADAFVAHQVFPVVPVEKQSDRYFSYNKGDWFRDEAEERAPGTESSGSGWDVDNTPNYYCRVYAHHKDVAEQDRLNQDQPINLDRDATEFVAQKLLIRRDRVFAANYFAPSIWGNTDQTGVSSSPSSNQFLQWNDAASDPIANIKDRAIEMESVTGFKPNVLCLGPRVFRVLEDHAMLLDRVKYTGGNERPAKVSAQAMAAIFGVDRVVVPGGVYNSAAKGATAAVDFIFGKGALLVYANPRPSILMPSAGYTFLWTNMSGGRDGARIKKWWIEEIESDRIEGEMAFDLKIVNSDCGQFFASCVA
jgi:hypothetical protein